jgi:hypothetical protein
MTALAPDRLALEVVAVSHMVGNDRSRRAVERYVERFGDQHEGLLRNWQLNDSGTVADMHRYTTTREQYAAAVAEGRA